MAFAPNNLLRLALVPEVTPGVTPATPTFQTMRVTKPSDGATKSIYRSEEFTGNRFGRKNHLTGIDVSPAYDFELSYGTFDVLLAAVMRGAWATNVLKDAATAAAFTLEEADLGGTSAFVRYQGLFPDEMSLSLASRKEITGSVKFFGMGQGSGTTAISGATYTAATTTDVLTTGTAVGALSISGLTTQPVFRSIDLSIKNGLGTREQLGSLYSLEPTSAPIEIEITGEAYFSTVELYQAAMAHGSGALSFQIGAVSGSKYQVDVPVARFIQPDRERHDLAKDQMLKLTMRAEYDATLGATMKITRGVS